MTTSFARALVLPGCLIAWDLQLRQIQLAVHARRLRSDGHKSGKFGLKAQVMQPVQITLYDELFPLTAGEVLEVFFSNRFTPQVMPEVLAEAGLTLVRRFSLTRTRKVFTCAPR